MFTIEIKINKEIREYTESIFFGLSLRQLLFSGLAVATAVILFFSLRGVLHIEILGWLCILGAAPWAALGFIRFNGLNCDQLVMAFVRSELLMPRHLPFCSTNLYKDATAEIREIYRKENSKCR